MNHTRGNPDWRRGPIRRSELARMDSALAGASSYDIAPGEGMDGTMQGDSGGTFFASAGPLDVYGRIVGKPATGFTADYYLFVEVTYEAVSATWTPRNDGRGGSTPYTETVSVDGVDMTAGLCRERSGAESVPVDTIATLDPANDASHWLFDFNGGSGTSGGDVTYTNTSFYYYNSNLFFQTNTNVNLTNGIYLTFLGGGVVVFQSDLEICGEMIWCYLTDEIGPFEEHDYEVPADGDRVVLLLEHLGFPCYLTGIEFRLTSTVYCIVNTDDEDLILANEDTGSAEFNRFALPEERELILHKDDAAIAWYDLEVLRWRCLASTRCHAVTGQGTANRLAIWDTARTIVDLAGGNKGSILGHTEGAPEWSPAPDSDGQVPLSDATEDIGWRWGDASEAVEIPAGRDELYYRRVANRYYFGGHPRKTLDSGLASLAPAPGFGITRAMLAVPFFNKRAGTLDRVGWYIDASSGTTPNLPHWRAGIAANIEDEQYPGAYLFGTAERELGPGATTFLETVDWDLEAETLYWLLLGVDIKLGTASVAAFAGLAIWCILGWNTVNPLASNGECGWKVLSDYDDLSLGGSFPGSATMIDTIPAIGVRYASFD